MRDSRALEKEVFVILECVFTACFSSERVSHVPAEILTLDKLKGREKMASIFFPSLSN